MVEGVLGPPMEGSSAAAPAVPVLRHLARGMSGQVWQPVGHGAPATWKLGLLLLVRSTQSRVRLLKAGIPVHSAW